MRAYPAEKRKFYRHPISVPIRYLAVQQAQISRPLQSTTVDLSEGGICFLANDFLAKGAHLNLSIPVGDQVFTIRGQVAYSNLVPQIDRYRTGVAFTDPDSTFKAKLAEQMLQIKQYREKISQETAAEISEEEATRQWIEKYARHFSALF